MAAFFWELDVTFPNGKFVPTVRDEYSWIESACRHFGDQETTMRYGKGSSRGNEEIYLARYRQHMQVVLDYFDGRSDPFLVMNIAGGDDWRTLAPYLGNDLLTEPFPHEKKGHRS